MPHEVLLEFLKLGLIDVSGNDERLQKLSQTATDVSSLVKKAPNKTIPFTLIALDPDAPGTDPVVSEVLSALKLKWPTYPNAFADTPVTLVRAILLDALVDAAADDPNVAIAFACIARNMMPYIKASSEQSAWTTALGQVEVGVDKRASREWTTPSTIQVGVLKFTPKTADLGGKITRKGTNKETLQRKISDAFVSTQQGGQNHYYPHNNPTQWTQQVAVLLSEGLSEIIDTVVKSIEFSGGDFSGPFAALADAVSKYVDSAINSVAIATGGIERRTNLLWWKESLYSPSARVSYRDMSITVAAALMSLDLSEQVPVFSPASVVAFLRESVRALSQDHDVTFTIRQLVDEARFVPELLSLRTAASNLVSPITGRGPLLSVIAQPQGVAPDDEKFVEYVGIPLDTALRAEDWARWIYCELQALKAVHSRKPRK